MNELIKKIEERKSIDLNLELKNLKLTEEEVFLLASYISLNNISLIRESLEAKASIEYISDEVKDFFSLIKKGKLIENIEDKKYIEYINLSVANAIRNIKITYSLLDLIESAYVLAATFIDKYYNKLKIKYDDKKILEIFNIYSIIQHLLVQIEAENNEYNIKISLIVYLKIKERLANDEDLIDILKSMDLDERYYENLKANYEDIELLEVEDLLEYFEKVKKDYEDARNTFVFNIIEENLLISYLALEGHKYTKKNLMEKFKLNEEEFAVILNEIFKKVSETYETY